MTTPIASPSPSIPDAGATAAKAAAAPETGDSFGAMLAQVTDVTDPAAADSVSDSQASGSQATGIAVPDPAAVAAAFANQAPWMAQLDAAKADIANEDATPAPDMDGVAADSAKQALDAAKTPKANQTAAPVPAKPAAANAPVLNEAQGPEPEPMPAPAQAAVPATAQQTSPQELAADETGNTTPVVTTNVPDETAATQDNPAEAASPAQTAAAAPNPPKNEKPVHKDGEENASPPPDTMDLTELSSRVAAQFLAAPAPQTAPAPAPEPGSQANPDPKPEELTALALSTAAQTTAPRSAPPDKSGNPKAAAANTSETRPTAPHNARATADAPPAADAAPAPNAGDAANHGTGNNTPPAEHGAKSEPATAANPAPPPAMSNGPNHPGIDLSSAPPANAQTATPPDMNVPVKLSFTPPGPADVPSFDALALRIAARSSNGENNFSLRLDPPELGRIEVNLNVRSDGHAQAELSADKPQTLELLQKDASSLERALKDAGLNLAGGLSFSLKGDGKSQAWRDGQGSARGRTLQIAATDAANANAAISAGAALAGRVYGLSTAHLDIRV